MNTREKNFRADMDCPAFRITWGKENLHAGDFLPLLQVLEMDIPLYR